MNKKEMIKTNKVGKIEEMLIKAHKENIGYDSFIIGETLTQNCGVLLDGKYKVLVTKGGDWYVTIEEWIDKRQNIPTKHEVFCGTINFIDGKECRWSKKVVENAAKIIANAIDKYEGKIDENLNGFTCQEQYEAVRTAVNDCVGRSEIEVEYDKDTDTIYVDGWFYSFSIAGDMLIGITMEDSSEMDDVTAIYDSLSDIWEAFEANQPKEEEVNA